MDIYEYQAKDVLAKFGVPVPRGGLAYSPEQAAEFIRTRMKKPLAAYVAGLSAPKRRKMGHAGAIIQAFAKAPTRKSKSSATPASGSRRRHRRSAPRRRRCSRWPEFAPLPCLSAVARSAMAERARLARRSPQGEGG